MPVFVFGSEQLRKDVSARPIYFLIKEKKEKEKK